MTVGVVSVELEARLAKFESDMGRAARIAEKQAEAIAKAADRSAARQEAAAAKAAAAQIRAAEMASRAQIAAMEKAAAAQAALLEKQLAESQQRFSKVAAAAAIAGIAFVAFEKHLIDVGDNLNDLSKQFGISVETLSVWRISAEKSGTSLEGVAKGAKILSKDLDDTETKLKAMGLSLRDATGKAKPMETVMEEIAKKFSGYSEGAEKAQAATALFGKAGVELIPFLNDLGENLEENRTRALAFGSAMDTDFARAADQFNDNLRDVQSAAEGFGVSVLKNVLPALNDWIEHELDLAEKHDGMRVAGELLGKEIAEEIKTFREASDAVMSFVASLDELIGKAPAVQSVLSTAFGVVKEVASFLNPLKLVALADPKNNPVVKFFESIGIAAPKAASAINNLVDPIVQASQNSAVWTTELGRVVTGLNAFDRAAKETAPDLDAQAKAAKAAAEAAKKAAEAAKAKAAADKVAAEAARKLKEEEDQEFRIMAEGLAAHEALNRVLADYAKAQDDVREAIEKRHEIEERNVRLAGMDAEARKRAENAVAAIAAATLNYNAALAAGIPLTEEQLAAEILLTEARLNGADATNKESAATREFAEAMKRDGEAAVDDFLSALLRGEDGFKDFGQSLERMAGFYLDNISKMFRQTVLTPGGGGISQFASNMQQAGQQNPTGMALAGTSLAYSGWRNAATGGSRLSTVAQFTAAGAAYGSIIPVIGTLWGAAIGAVVGILVAVFKKSKPPDVRLGGAGADVRKVEGNFQTALGTVQIGTRATDQTPIREAVQKFDQTIHDMVGTVAGGSEQLAKISASLNTWSVDLKGDADNIGNLLGLRFDRILSTFDADIQGFVNGADKLEDRVQRLGDAFAAQATFSDLGLDVTFKQFLDIVDDMQTVGETASQTMQRITGSVSLFGDALQFMGVTVDKTGEAFIRFATEIADAAGGLDRASKLWDGFLNRFYSPEEIAQKSVDALTQAADEAFAAIGADSLPSMEAFRAQFEAALPTLSPDQIVAYLQAGNALADLADAETALAQLRGQTADDTQAAAEAEEQLRQRRRDLSELLSDANWDSYLDGLSDFDRQMAELRKHWSDLIRQATLLGASESDLTHLRELEDLAIERLTATAQELIDTIDPRGSIYQPPGQVDLGDISNAITGIIDYINRNLLDQSVTTLTPTQQLAAAREQYEKTLQLAKGGDASALQALPGIAQTFEQLARGYYSSGDMFDTIFSKIQTDMRGLVQSLAPDRMAEIANAASTYLPQIAGYLQTIAASYAAQPSYDTGTAYVPYDQTARIHRGEMVIDAATASGLRQYGIPASGGDPELKPLLRELLQKIGAREQADGIRQERLIRVLERLS